MVTGVDDRHDTEVRVTALFEVVALFVARVAGGLTELPLPGLMPRRPQRGPRCVLGWEPAVSPATIVEFDDGAAAVPAA